MCVRGGYLEEDLIRDPVGLRRYIDSGTHTATQNLMPMLDLQVVQRYLKSHLVTRSLIGIKKRETRRSRY